MKGIVSGDRLAKALEQEGLLPPNCRLLEFSLEPMHAACLRYEVFVTLDDLPKLARALLTIANNEPSDA